MKHLWYQTTACILCGSVVTWLIIMKNLFHTMHFSSLISLLNHKTANFSASRFCFFFAFLSLLNVYQIPEKQPNGVPWCLIYSNLLRDHFWWWHLDVSCAHRGCQLCPHELSKGTIFYELL